MRFSIFAALFGSASLTTALAAQAPANLFDIWACTNFTSRGALGNSPGDDLLQVSAASFTGVGHDAAGAGTSLHGFNFAMQDQNAATVQTYSLIIRADAGGQPSATAAGLLFQSSLLTSPSGTGTTAWIITVDLATPSTVVPLCATYYTGTNLSAAPSWPNDGISFHIGTQALLGGTQAGNPSPAAGGRSHLAWNILGGTGGSPTQPGGFRTIRYGHRVTSALLRVGGTDPTLLGNTANCVSGILNSTGAPVCYATGGMFPGATSGRSDGLDCRIRDVANAGGAFVTFLGGSLGCPGLPLAGLASGALYLNPSGAFVQVASGLLNAAGVGDAVMLPPGVAGAFFVNRPLSFQSFSVGPAFALPGALSNMCTVTYL